MNADDVRALREAGKHPEHLDAARQLVAAEPANVLAQIEAAFGYDRNDFESDAIRHYDEAYRLGVPAQLQRRFCIGYGSTLRNVGRIADAVAILERASADDPTDPAIRAFLALALLSSGNAPQALATMLGCALDAARDGAFDGYERALRNYQCEL
ncbi:MAG: tetratricopeptide repeat protein [Kofleriaceae bacterium]